MAVRYDVGLKNLLMSTTFGVVSGSAIQSLSWEGGEIAKNGRDRSPNLKPQRSGRAGKTGYPSFRAYVEETMPGFTVMTGGEGPRQTSVDANGKKVLTSKRMIVRKDMVEDPVNLKRTNIIVKYQERYAHFCGLADSAPDSATFSNMSPAALDELVALDEAGEDLPPPVLSFTEDGFPVPMPPGSRQTWAGVANDDFLDESREDDEAGVQEWRFETEAGLDALDWYAQDLLWRAIADLAVGVDDAEAALDGELRDLLFVGCDSNEIEEEVWGGGQLIHHHLLPRPPTSLGFIVRPTLNPKEVGGRGRR